MKIIQAKFPSPYNINIGTKYINSDYLLNYLKSLTSSVIVITDTNVNMLYGNQFVSSLTGINVNKYVMPAGDQAKNREVMANIQDFMQENKISKDSIILALGGGVVTDIAGFIGATYLRGIKTIYIPTTMLCIVDAAIGGKTAINTDYGKNQLGTITSPYAIFVDTEFLKSQDGNSWRDGWVETLKHALLESENNLLEVYKNYCDFVIGKLPEEKLLEICYTSCNTKNKIVAADPYEKGKRASLNIGHNIGHALELYFKFTISHGQGVAIGIITESYIAVKLSILSKSKFELINKIFRPLAGVIEEEIDIINFLKLLSFDKKNRKNELRFCLLEDIGRIFKSGSYTKAIKSELVIDALKFMNKEFVESNRIKAN